MFKGIFSSRVALKDTQIGEGLSRLHSSVGFPTIEQRVQNSRVDAGWHKFGQMANVSVSSNIVIPLKPRDSPVGSLPSAKLVPDPLNEPWCA